MTAPPPQRIAEIARWLRTHVRPQLMARVSSPDLETLLRDLLFGSHDMWQAAQEGIVTKEEASSFVIAHVDTWVLDQTGESYATAFGGTLPAPNVMEFVDLVFGKPE